MARFNQKNNDKAPNQADFPAFRMKEKEQLAAAALTTLFGEQKYYGSTDIGLVRLATRCAVTDPDFLLRLAAYARNEANLRTVSHVLTSVIAREAPKYTRAAVRNVVVRGDDITEIMACYLSLYGKPFPNALKRAVANAVRGFDEYALAKYAGRGRALKMRDVLRITHPKPRDEKTAALFKKVLDGTLETPYTWETELSERGSTAEVWNDLIASGRVGYMALMRNLRNIVKTGADLSPGLALLSDPEQVKKSRQLPYRFFSAYAALRDEDLLTPQILETLEKALEASSADMETIPGRTLIAVDVSGSMRSPVSAKSAVRCRDIACLLGVMSSRLCEDAEVCYFDMPGRSSALPSGRGYEIRRYKRTDPILPNCGTGWFRGGGTQMDLPLLYALEEDPEAAKRPFDRVIYFSDNQCNHSRGGFRQTVQVTADQYREKYNPDLWVHAVDLMGYGTQQFVGPRFDLIAGWSERVLPFITLAEKGLDTLVDHISRYSVK